MGYGSINIGGKPYYVHRLAWFYMTGAWPDDQIDHRNGWRLDNAFANLREATCSQNNSNRKPSREGRLKGAYKVGNRWKAQINLKSGWEYLGYFDTEREAHEAYVRRATEAFGEFARLN
ncbi:HNH endonuclease [Brevundimonas sp. TWP1-2-1b1]|uniref:HNH endonuclease n=1 Tax=unclassified Brevundimonas TaxID=2622653 RepID=UPI003CF51D61